MQKPNVTRPGSTKIPLFWDRKGDKKHIGYYYPAIDKVGTVNGSFSTLNRMGFKGRIPVPEPKNKMHLRRIEAAYKTKDFTYSGQ